MKVNGTLVITDPCYIVLDKSDDWKRCEYGENMNILGIHTSLVGSTLFGDGSTAVYKVYDNPYIIIETIVHSIDKGIDYIMPSSYLGGFGIDSGQFGVFLLDELKAYNPKTEEWIASHPWFAAVVPDFEGDVRYYTDSIGRAHIVGAGNFNFITE